MRSFVKGSKDISGDLITRIFSLSDEYVIYEIKTPHISDSIKIQIDTIIEEDKILIERFDKIRLKYNQVKGLLYKVNDDTSLKTRIAHILSQGLTADTDSCNTEFDNLIYEININYRDQFNHRLSYIVTIMILTLISISVSVVIHCNNYSNHLSIINEMIYLISAGCLGGFISVSRRLNAMIFEKDVHRAIYVIYGIERIFISVVGSIIIYFSIKSNLIFGLVNELDKPIYGFIVFGVLAGFSETLIPNLLIKLENDQ
ncbi:hypothetical protein [Flavobacterium sp. UBA7680]|uniref:hypothetical protein n=1 Tax=Flavobacterium sp. UBA7680 TaxID=1946559 RepID=UPI0025C65E22|nr:hypothetical protein [Flavobacterium sp. UBA7680]